MKTALTQVPNVFQMAWMTRWLKPLCGTPRWLAALVLLMGLGVAQAGQQPLAGCDGLVSR